MNLIREHRFALRAALARIRSAPGGFLFNVLVIALALILPVAGLTVVDNLRPLARDLAVEPEISLFLDIEAPRERVQALAAEIRTAAGEQGLRAKVSFVSRETALEALRERAGLTDVVAALGSNPLPDAYVVRLPDALEDAGAPRIEALAKKLRKLDGVDTVQLDSDWVKRLAALLQLATTALWLLAATLAGVVLVVVFNTIRLQVMNQSDEVAVSRLLGATDGFIARPFYYTGGLLCLGAGALALLGVTGGLLLLNASVGQLARLYGSSFELVPPGMLTIAALLASTAGLGVLGAALSVRHSLRQAA